MKSMFTFITALFLVSTAHADWAYLRVVKPMTEAECHANVQMPEIFDFLLRTASQKYHLVWSNYFHPRTIGCSPIDEQPMLFAHGIFEGDKKDIEALRKDAPSFETFKMETFPLQALEAHYYLYGDAGIEPINDVFIRRFTSLDDELHRFALRLCNGIIPMLKDGLADSPKADVTLPIVNESKNIILFGYNQITGIRKDGSKIDIIPFGGDINGLELNCIHPIKW